MHICAILEWNNILHISLLVNILIKSILEQFLMLAVFDTSSVLPRLENKGKENSSLLKTLIHTHTHIYNLYSTKTVSCNDFINLWPRKFSINIITLSSLKLPNSISLTEAYCFEVAFYYWIIANQICMQQYF